MSKARVISGQDVLRIRQDQKNEEEITAQKKAKAAECRAAKTAKLTAPTTTPKPKRNPKKSVHLESSSDALTLESLNFGSELESDWMESGDDLAYEAGNLPGIMQTVQRIT